MRSMIRTFPASGVGRWLGVLVPSIPPLLATLWLAGTALGATRPNPHAAAGSADGPAQGVNPADQPTAQPPGPPTAPPATLTGGAPVASASGPVPGALYAALTAVLDDEKLQLAALSARVAQTTDPEAALALQREIESLKLTTQLRLLEVQERVARESGQLTLATSLAASMARMREQCALSAQAAARHESAVETETPDSKPAPVSNSHQQP